MAVGWGAADGFQEQIEQTLQERMLKARLGLLGKGKSECEDCGDEIPVARRKAYPAAVRCINCQKLFEIKGR